MTQSPLPISDLNDAKAVIHQLCETMDALIRTLAQETEFVRKGKLREAAMLEATKSELAAQYLSNVARVKASTAYFSQHAPQLLDALRQRHAGFQALLQINLTVLATAHAVSEGIVRGVAGELAKKSSPQIYSASGRTNSSPRSAIEPVALSRTL